MGSEMCIRDSLCIEHKAVEELFAVSRLERIDDLVGTKQPHLWQKRDKPWERQRSDATVIREVNEHIVLLR